MQDEKDFDWEKHVKECLDSTLVAILATKDGKNIWATPVYFSYDEKLNFYFISPEYTRHMKDIKKDPNVALAIITPSSTSGVFQIGLQIEGKANEVPDREIEKVYATRSVRLSGEKSWVPMPTEGHFVKEHGGIFMRVVPSNVNYIDTRYFGGNSKRVPLGKIGRWKLPIR